MGKLFDAGGVELIRGLIRELEHEAAYYKDRLQALS